MRTEPHAGSTTAPAAEVGGPRLASDLRMAFLLTGAVNERVVTRLLGVPRDRQSSALASVGADDGAGQ